jgi:hypothetical protein
MTARVGKILACVMKRASTAILLLLAAGGMGRAVALCAESPCLVPPSVCCCHRAERREAVRLVRPMACEDSSQSGFPWGARAEGDLRWSAGGHACCSLSSSPVRPLGEAASRSLIARSSLLEGGALCGAGWEHCRASPLVSVPAASCEVSSELSPIYLRIAVLRI